MLNLSVQDDGFYDVMRGLVDHMTPGFAVAEKAVWGGGRLLLAGSSGNQNFSNFSVRSGSPFSSSEIWSDCHHHLL